MQNSIFRWNVQKWGFWFFDLPNPDLDQSEILISTYEHIMLGSCFQPYIPAISFEWARRDLSGTPEPESEAREDYQAKSAKL